MRLDKFLKVSRLIKRRTIAKEACDKGMISINGKVAKAGDVLKEGDIIEINFGSKAIKAEVVDLKEHVLKDEAENMYKLL
ncbi:RNA-binding S4 domain-containing protein [Thermoanaerobacterium sp. RBIITD]|uniref:RNA-binding S4 domain-containing protein n=1 Tax=Thermoanaerobacterium sp. RBIITD TaxID=1550240 RepID=UPI000BB812EA|nr:RNA-binding S4 domain-containing protein [Thermoanaerobacterium sp. RBIITD]SNX54030.1 Ribosomal 50S subunit-recycling heat shock protein, contains S4 domain [Thermoanaerobacterium sp. RBIITD]